MFATIRRYTPAAGTFEPGQLAQLRRQLQEEFLPLIREVSGFHSYYAVDCGGSELVTVSVFESREGGDESTRVARDYVARTSLPVQLSPAIVSQGEVLASAESPVGAR